ncbi:MAG: tRNA (adenosine(37)-N6)-threonylcarbamoyltransferase complex ATPase subunit type 1 TsaE [Cytophagaceae bacterium]|nr:tRNA (adenosine(37)-N6)-threonylcarbamoyltransferase complex ATPase subunit type 1 TsaE [Cytophagaceae bacterium]
MPQITLRCASLSAIDETARAVLDVGASVPVWLFEGDMGAGKTTFIKALCRRLGVVNLVQSPTFSLVNEYETEMGETVYHFDFYRIKSETEALDMGIEEYFDSGNYCFVEWPSKIENLWPPHPLMVRIEVEADGSRRIGLSVL